MLEDKTPVGVCDYHCDPFYSTSGFKRPRWAHLSSMLAAFPQNLDHVMIHNNDCFSILVWLTIFVFVFLIIIF